MDAELFGIRRALVACSAVALLVAAACAPKVNLALPAGAGTPLTDLAAAERTASTACATHPALTADLRLSGRIDGERVRGTLQVGVTGDAMRLEGLAPFGAPVFVLAAQAGRATLLLPRESAVAHGDSAADLLEAVVGVALTPADLLAVVSGCGLAERTVRGGATFGEAWTRIDLEGDRRLWIHRLAEGGPAAIVAAEDDRWRVEYTRRDAGWPMAIRLLQRAAGPVRTDAVFAVDAPEAMDALPAGALDVEIPKDAREVTLADLRKSRELRER